MLAVSGARVRLHFVLDDSSSVIHSFVRSFVRRVWPRGLVSITRARPTLYTARVVTRLQERLGALSRVRPMRSGYYLNNESA